MERRYKIFLWAGLLGLIADQASKWWARTLPVDSRGYGIPQPVVDGFFDWRLSFNTGSAFSMFGTIAGARVILSLVGIGAVVAIFLMLRKAQPERRRLPLALGLVAGGAIGNVIDRILYGKVTDFVVWKYHQHEWPTFNVADAALVVGVVLLFLDVGKEKQPAEASAPADAKPAPRSARRR